MSSLQPLIITPEDKIIRYFDAMTSQYVPTLFKEGSKGVNRKIMDVMATQLCSLQSYYSSVLVSLLIFQLPYDGYTEDNQIMGKFMKSYISAIKQRYEQSEIVYVWVREQDKSSAQHYHLTFMLSGHACQSIYHLYEIAKEIWGRLVPTGKVYYPRNPIYKVKRQDALSRAEVLCRLSYLAKNATKRTVRSNHNYGSSRLEPK